MDQHNIMNTCSSSSMSSSPSQSWVRGTCIGRGCFGSVNTAISKTNGGVFAVKSVDLATCLPIQLESLEYEISLLRSLKPHPNIVEFLGDGVSKEGTTSFRNLYLEYLAEGDVANYYSIGGIKDETLLRRYTACLVSALSHVHSQGFVHCDVKSRNTKARVTLVGEVALSIPSGTKRDVLVTETSEIKLADFGSAIRVERSTAPITPRGSPLWMAPEVIRREYQDPESDVWSLGCTIIEMLTGKPGWGELGMIDTLSRNCFSDELPVFPVTLSEIGCDFLNKCLKRDPNQRWSCDQLMQHPFLSQSHNLTRTESSPRCVLDWVNLGFDLEEEEGETEERSEFKNTAMARICKLGTKEGAKWDLHGWVEVRSHASEAEETTKEYTGSTRVQSELNTLTDPYDDVADNLAITEVSVSPNRSPGNQDSTTAPSYESVMVLFILIEVMVYFIRIRTVIYCCYQYHNNKNKNNKLEVFSLKYYLFAHVFRIVQG